MEGNSPMGDRIPQEAKDRIRARIVRFGELFDSDELRDRLVELELPEPTPEPAEEPTEPWAWGEHKHMPHPLRRVLERYRERHPFDPEEVR